MMKKVLTAFAAGTITLSVMFCSSVYGQSEAFVKIPDFEGPIPVTETSHPFTVGGTDLAANGYVLEEYYVSGTSNVYDWGEDGSAEKPQVRTADAPYTTRIVVRKPQNTGSFSGNVWVELNNPSRGWDVEVQWPVVQEEVMSSRDIWVAMTAKPNVIAALKRVDEERYGKLSMDNPLPPEEQTAGLLPGEEGYDENLSKLYENGLVWDMFSQVGALMRDKNGPLAGYDVKYVFGTGESQTGFYLNTYAANFAEDAMLEEGKTVYDGFISASGAGKVIAINQDLEPLGPDDPRSRLPQKHVPFMRIDSQGDIFRLGSYEWRREDCDDEDAGYRIYEIAGAPHGPSYIMGYQPLEADILKTGNLPSQVPYQYGGIEEKANHFYRQYMEKAMYYNFKEWVINGTLPPKAEPIEVTEDGTAFVYDEHGNVKGGVRSPALDVPTATYHELATEMEGQPYAWSFGSQEDFSTSKLQELYGVIEPQQTYVKMVEESADKLTEEGFLLPEDAAAISVQAQYTPIP